ncbi:hypothetical protein NMG29_06460 [Streptomyces cocklensis]|uniref:Uncharacterized protein n=1 Tax=Actinacidiphila cocklensis TaxID=887465 RepID=A0A9W4DMJ7_9ACTN|nr:hypothetical protein [Actinacidiphila cocklensis]MDD1057873.1 hypothetical protein [Actinacidiphila cocklensis]CAG6392734.1 hypothetical protein SCOCK_180111 [Actinacidiphila cocklensis]
MTGLLTAGACFLAAALVYRLDRLRVRRTARERTQAAGPALLLYIPQQVQATTEGDCLDCDLPRTRNHVCKDRT